MESNFSVLENTNNDKILQLAMKVKFYLFLHNLQDLVNSIDEEKWIALHVECLNFYRKLASMLDGSLNDAAFDLLCQIMEVFPNKFWSTVFDEKFDLLKEYLHD